MADENKIRDAADAVKGIVEAVPIYQDAVQPAMKEVGIALQTIAQAIHIAISPISALVWGYDKIKDFVLTRVAEKLKDVPPENITTPSPNVVGPALEALRFTGHDENLRELYANLLATSLDSNTALNAHPSFVEIIKNMSPDEARILRLFISTRAYPLINVKAEAIDKSGYLMALRNFSLIGQAAGCDHCDLTPSYLDNLCRLGLLEIPEDAYLTAPDTYDSLENFQTIINLRRNIDKSDKHKSKISKKVVRTTALGEQFCQACVIEKNAVGKKD